MEVINNNQIQESKYKKPSAASTVGGIAAGTAVYGLSSYSAKKITQYLNKPIGNFLKSVSNDEFSAIQNSIEESLDASGLSKKGVSILPVNFNNREEISKIITDDFKRNLISKISPKQYINKINQGSIDGVMTGQNSIYSPLANKILLPMTKLNIAVFHEMGHAANTNLSHFGKALQKLRFSVALSAPIVLIGLLKNKKASDQKPTSRLDKITTFIRENAGKLAFATALPALLEEGLASIKGQKFAKKALSPELAKKVLKFNALAYSTYLSILVLPTLGLCLGMKLKDLIAKHQVVENN